MVRVQYIGTVRLFCDGTGTVRCLNLPTKRVTSNLRPSMKIRVTMPGEHLSLGYSQLRRVHTEPVNVYVTVPSPFSVLPLFGGDGNLNVRGSH